MTIDDLKQKKIAILGYGINNKQLVLFLIGQGIPVTIREKKPELHTDLGSLVTWDICGDILKKLEAFDMVFRSPAIPFLSPQLQKAQRNGVEVYSQTKLFFDLCPAKIIGITGTKGKGTTASLTYDILKQGYTEGKVYLAGNIGVDPFSFFSELTESDLVILELSSFQLQDLHKSPHIAVLLTVGTDHQDHHRSIEEYHNAKRNIFAYQEDGDSAILNIFNSEMLRFSKLSQGMTYLYNRFSPRQQSAWVDREEGKETIFVQVGADIHSLDSTDRKLRGDHNLDNILPAVIIGSLYAIDPEILERAIREFKGLEHRLHFVGEFTGVSFYDDSIATTVEASLAAMKSFPGKRIHLIAGGNDKGDDYTPLANYVLEHCATVSLLPGTATKKLSTHLKRQKRSHPSSQLLILDAATDPYMPTILSGIHPNLQSGDIVLLSPAGSSFGAFKNAKERGNLFVKAVHDRYTKDY